MEHLSLNYSVMDEPQSYMALVRRLLCERFDSPPLAYLHSYGCQQSVADGEKLRGLLEKMGYGFTDSPQQAELVLFNTCAVRHSAEQRILGNVGALKQSKEQRPSMIIALSGCMTEQPHIAQKLKKSYPYVDIAVGSNAFAVLPRLIYEKLNQNKRSIGEQHQLPGELIIEGIPIRREGTLKAWVSIMYGCDNFCSYCIVPYVRGRERSRASADILNEVRGLVNEGYRDITLLGQNVNSYGKGLEESINFSELLRRINDIEGDFRIRFMTSHPKDCTRELLDTMAECPRVSKHLHLPVQSGSNGILKAMNRRYTVEDYLALVDYARQRMPDICLTSDIIVGFPGESRADFEKTMELLKCVKYSSVFSFIYSRRSGTRAIELPDPVTKGEKSKWMRELLSLQVQIGDELMYSYVGKTLRVLAESEGRESGTLSGRSDGNLIVEFPAKGETIGSFVTVRIIRAKNSALFGELIE